MDTFTKTSATELLTGKNPVGKDRDGNKARSVGLYMSQDDWRKVVELMHLYRTDGNVSQFLRMGIRDLHGFHVDGKAMPDFGGRRE